MISTVFLRNSRGLIALIMLFDQKSTLGNKGSYEIYDPDKHIIEVGESMAVVANRFLNKGFSIEETEKLSSTSEFVKNVQTKKSKA